MILYSINILLDVLISNYFLRISISPFNPNLISADGFLFPESNFVSEENNAKILMTLTSPNCPVAESLPVDVEEKVKTLKEINECEVEITFDPTWTQEMMSEEAKLELGML